MHLTMKNFDNIDMAAISTWRIDTIDTPAKLDSMRCPICGDSG